MPRPTARATRAIGPVVIDGVLDEADWSRAERLTNFVQAMPHAGQPATEPTLVRILYDDRRLYLSAECGDAGPLFVAGLEQDFDSTDSDLVGLGIDTFHDRRNGFMFLINPYGAVRDVQHLDDGRSNSPPWEGVVEVRTRVYKGGWTVELAIPFSTVRFNPKLPEQVWGLNLVRRIRRNNEESYWAPLDRTDKVYRFSKAGTLVGMTDIRAGRNIGLKPYGLLGTSSGSARPAELLGLDYNAGLDVKYGVTPRLTLDLTVRTDFSQVEVDQEQVNLTRFSLFFPEKRDFFIENSGVFSFGDIAERNQRSGATLSDFTMFHSRRIGLTPGGQPIPIVGGGRLSGRVGGAEMGFLNMQTEATGTTPAENFTVVRLRRKLMGQSDFGVLFTNKSATSGAGTDGQSLGFDANVRLWKYLAINSYVAGTFSGTTRATNLASRLAVGWRDRFWDVSTFVKQVDDGFNPAIGFVARRGMRHTYATVGVHPRPGRGWIQEVNPYAELDYITNLQSVLETRTGTAGAVTQFVDGSSIDGRVVDNFERITSPFQVAGARITPGDYQFRQGSLSYQSNAGRVLSGRVQVGGGGFYSGTRRNTEVAVLWRPNYRLETEVSATRNAIRVPTGDTDANILATRVKVGLSTRLQVSGFLQYNAAAGYIVTNLRLNLIHAPLSHLYVAYVERRPSSSGGPPLERDISVKLTRLLSF